MVESYYGSKEAPRGEELIGDEQLFSDTRTAVRENDLQKFAGADGKGEEEESRHFLRNS